ncbi:MAG: peptidoglycan editing factor PgeF [Minwuia sp.]|nr:peptidoglycan editing factor PgeF [Minwuia sp.]
MSLTTLSSPDLTGLPGIAHGFFTRKGGVSRKIHAGLNCGPGSTDDPMAVTINRDLVRRHFGARHLLTVHQHHSADVVTVTDRFDGPRPKADAMVTQVPRLALGVLSADCGPLLFADAGAQVIGAAHSGWKGALDGVLQATVAAMEALGARRDRISVTLGPTLAQASYEVGPEFRDRFEGAGAENARFFRQPDDAPRPFFDLPAFIRHQAEMVGVAHFHDLARDTYPEPDLFYSYRRSVHRGEADYGRLISAIMLKET